MDVTNYILLKRQLEEIAKNTGGASSWNDLEDKPFGEEIGVSDTITWDGTKGDVYAELEVNMGAPLNMLFNRVSDSTPESEVILGSTVVASSSTVSKVAYTVTEERLNAVDDILLVSNPDSFFPVIIIAYRDGVEYNIGPGVLVFPKKGVYFINMSAVDAGELVLMCDSITVPNYEFTTTVIKKIDPKYLPPTGGGSDYGGLKFFVNENGIVTVSIDN